MNKIRLLILAFSICLLAACAPSAQAVQTAISETQAALLTATTQPTQTPRPDINSVLLANGFILKSTQSQTSSKKYQIVTNAQIPDLEAVVNDNGMFSIIVDRIGNTQTTIVRNVLLIAYGPLVANWVTPIIAEKDFSQLFEQNGTVGGYNIDIKIAGQVGWRILDITIMPVSQ